MASYADEVHEKLKLQESSLLACSWSPCGRYVVCGSNFGRLCTWDAQPLLYSGSASVPDASRPVLAFELEEGSGPVSGLEFVGEDTLVCAAEDAILGFRWSDLLGRSKGGAGGGVAAAAAPTEADALFRIDASLTGTVGRRRPAMVPEFACIAPVPGRAGHCVVGCGDGCLRLYDLERPGELLAHWSGHSSAIHAVAGARGSGADQSTFVTAGEDGCAGVWDVRAREGQVRSTQLSGARRSDVWASACAVDAAGAWALIGGGVGGGGAAGGFATVLHLGSGRVLQAMRSEAAVMAAAATEEGWIVGAKGSLQVLPPVNLAQAELLPGAKVTAKCVYDVKVAPSTETGVDAPVAACGASPFCDLFAYAGHRSAVLGIA